MLSKISVDRQMHDEAYMHIASFRSDVTTNVSLYFESEGYNGGV